MTVYENSPRNGRGRRYGPGASGLVLQSFRFNKDLVLSDVQFQLKMPLGKIEAKPSFGTLSLLNGEAQPGVYQLFSKNGLWDLKIVNEQQNKLILDLLRRKFVCVAEVLTFHDRTEEEDVRGVVRLSLAFFLQRFRLPQGLEIRLPQKIADNLKAKRCSAKYEDVADNFMFPSGDGEPDCFAYFQGYQPEAEETCDERAESAKDEQAATAEADAQTETQQPDSHENAPDMSQSGPDASAPGAPEKESGYRLFGKKYDFDVVIAGPEGEEYLIVRRAVFKRKERPILMLARAKLTFCENPSPVARMLKETLTETAEYATTWERYSNVSGDFLLKTARKIGVLRLESIPSLEGGKRVVHAVQEIRGADVSEQEKYNPIELLDKDDQLVAVSTPPDYITEPLTWKEHEQREKDRKEREHIHEKPLTYKILNVDRASRTITLDTQENVDGLWVVSLKGEGTIIARREKARELLISGQTPNPTIAEIITHDLKEDAIVTAVDRAQPKVQRAALSGRVAQKIFPKNPPTTTQRRAIEIALNTPDIAIIQGPPGTGKTTVITAILERLNELSNKNGNVKGRVLITSLQHDAVKNVIERLRINSLPTIKFGGKEGDNDVEGSVSAWCAEIVKKLQDRNPQFRESRELEDFTSLYQLYCTSPSDENARLFLQHAKEATMAPSRQRRAEAILDELRPADAESDSELLRLVRRLRVKKGSFADDGARNAHALYDLLSDENALPAGSASAEILTTLREAAMCGDQPPSPELLTRLERLKGVLLERLIPRPAYRASQAREDISELYSEIKNELRRPLAGPNAEIDNVVFEFLRELETNPLDVGTAVKAYGYAYASTALQSDAKDIRQIKGLFGKANDNKIPEYDTVIVDEAARVNPCDLMIPLAQAKERIILVGDHRQLPHMYDEEVFEELQEQGETIHKGDIENSMFEHLINKAQALTKHDGVPRFVTLDAQYRMHPLLGKFASDEFYAPHGEKFDSPLGAEHFKQDLFDVPLVWLDVPYGPSAPCLKTGTSWRRDAEAEEIAERIKGFMEQEQKTGGEKRLTYGVISFYAAQVKTVQARLRTKLSEEDAKRVRVGSVDAFQGREFDVIFLSTVRSAPKPVLKAQKNDSRLSAHKGKVRDGEQDGRALGDFEAIGGPNYGFLTSANRLCVALTRQKKLLIVVGDSNIFAGPEFSAIAERCVPAMKHLYELCRKEGKVIPCPTR